MKRRANAKKPRPAMGIGRHALHIGAVLLLLSLLFYGGARWASRNQQQEQPRAELTDRFGMARTLEYEGRQYIYRDQLVSLLFLGIDRDTDSPESGSRFRNGGQADFWLLLVIDDAAQTITPVQIDRDTMTDITVLGVLGNRAGTSRQQICLSHSFGDGLEQSNGFSREALEGLLQNASVDFTLSLDMNAINTLTGLLGGVTVTIEEDLTEIDERYTAGASVTLTQDDADTYLRARRGVSDGTNRARMGRQRVYLLSAVEKLKALLAQDSSFGDTLFEGLGDDLVTDMSRGRLINVLYASRSYTVNPVEQIEGEYRLGEDGFVQFVADKAAVQQLVIRLFYREPD